MSSKCIRYQVIGNCIAGHFVGVGHKDFYFSIDYYEKSKDFLLTMSSLGISKNKLKGDTLDEILEDAERIIINKIEKRKQDFDDMENLLKSPNKEMTVRENFRGRV